MKRRLLGSQLPAPGRRVLLDESEANHAHRVLRLRDGDEVEVLDARGHSVRACLRMSGLGIELEYVGPVEASGTQKQVVPVTLQVGMLKGDAMEWVVEKATELGVSELVPLISDHSVIQIQAKGPDFFQKRWQKIADQALKQCGRLQRMQVQSPVRVQEAGLMGQRSESWGHLWCDEKSASGGAVQLVEWLASEQGSSFRGLSVWIGPEGGWSEAERRFFLQATQEVSGSKTLSVGLGPLVLRAETAALVSLSLVTSFVRAGRLVLV